MNGQTTAENIGTDAAEVVNAAAPIAVLAGPYGQAAIVAATGALAIYKALVPLIQDLANKGLVTAAEQAALNAAFQDIAVTHQTAFKGPEWKQD